MNLGSADESLAGHPEKGVSRFAGQAGPRLATLRPNHQKTAESEPEPEALPTSSLLIRRLRTAWNLPSCFRTPQLSNQADAALAGHVVQRYARTAERFREWGIMSDNEFQIQILMADEAVPGFLADSDLAASGIRIKGTKPAEETATLGFALVGAIIVINAVVTTLSGIDGLVAPLARLLKKSPKRVVVTTALGTVTLDPTHTLSEGEIRELLTKLATL
jgi:hypothetical protein